MSHAAPPVVDGPRLLAEVGGCHARFAIEAAPGRLLHMASLRCAEHADFHAAISAYLRGLGPEARGPGGTLEHAAVAVATPVEGDQVRMTNHGWSFSIEQMRRRLGLQTLVVVNDFTALAMALPRLGPGQRRQVGGGEAVARSVLGVLGPGPGLGVSGVVPAAEGWVALDAEGGHASFAPCDEREIAILQFALRRFPHVSFERLLSDSGLELMAVALRERAGLPALALPAAEITRQALDGSDAVCAEALDSFCAILGTAAANLALTLGAKAGVYIGGSIVPRLGAYFDRSPFRARFEHKGRFQDYLRAIPTYVVTDENASLLGVSAILACQLRSLRGNEGSALLGQIRRARDQLSPAEKRVADHVLAHPRAALSVPIAEIARAAAVSQPTVIRFCRSLGCEGLSDFKLRLASTLSATVPLMHTQVTGDDSMLELGVKVLGNTASAVLQLREQLKRDTLGRAIEVLSAARRVEFYALGHDGVVADDAQFKFLRFGLPSAALTDARLQLLAARVLQPGDVVLIVSSNNGSGSGSGSGGIDGLLAVSELARERGAAVIALTASHSPLARKADVALIVDHVEDVATQLPMLSRILHLLVIDILAVGVAMRRGGLVEVDEDAVRLLPTPPTAATAAEGLDPTRPEPAPADAQRAGMGMRGASPLARLTSHSR